MRVYLDISELPGEGGGYMDISGLPGEGGGIPGYIWATRGRCGYTWIYLSYQGKVGVYLDISGLPGEGGRVQGWSKVAPLSPLEYPLQVQGWSGRR